MTPSRREVFAAFFAASAAPPLAASAQSVDAPAIPGKRPMILHNDRPEDLESLGEFYTSWSLRWIRSSSGNIFRAPPR